MSIGTNFWKLLEIIVRENHAACRIIYNYFCSSTYFFKPTKA